MLERRGALVHFECMASSHGNSISTLLTLQSSHMFFTTALHALHSNITATLMQAERNYRVIQRECLAVIYLFAIILQQ